MTRPKTKPSHKLPSDTESDDGSAPPRSLSTPQVKQEMADHEAPPDSPLSSVPDLDEDLPHTNDIGESTRRINKYQQQLETIQENIRLNRLNSHPATIPQAAPLTSKDVPELEMAQEARAVEFEAESAKRRAASRAAKETDTDATNESTERRTESAETSDRSSDAGSAHKSSPPFSPITVQEEIYQKSAHDGMEKSAGGGSLGTASVDHVGERETVPIVASMQESEAADGRGGAQATVIGGVGHATAPDIAVAEQKGPTLGERILEAVQTSKRVRTAILTLPGRI